MQRYSIPSLPLSIDLETKSILKHLNKANKQLAELKGIVQTIPNAEILISTLGLQEAKDSSSIENIVTTHDELYKSDLKVADITNSAATKEVMDYREALQTGFKQIATNGLITNQVIRTVQQILVKNSAGFRKIPVYLKDTQGNVIYTPPTAANVEAFMSDLEKYINRENETLDPLIKLAVVHHQFESIHPFGDGNGRTGRILSMLLLVSNNLLPLPILYLSRYITHNKNDYYAKLQAIRETSDSDNTEAWEAWIIFILKGIEVTSMETIILISRIQILMKEYKQTLQAILKKSYRHELLKSLFYNPYTKIDFIKENLNVERITATRYLNQIVEAGLLEKEKKGRSNYYINRKLVDCLMNLPVVNPN